MIYFSFLKTADAFFSRFFGARGGAVKGRNQRSWNCTCRWFFCLWSFLLLKHDLGLCCKSELPRTSLLQVVQSVLRFKLNLLASVFKKQRRWVLEIVLVLLLYSPTGSISLRDWAVYCLLMILGLILFLFIVLKCNSLNLCCAITGFEMLSKCHGMFGRNV